MAKTKKKVVQKSMRVGKFGPEPGKRFEGGDYYAIKRNPVSLKKTNSTYRKLLNLLSGCERPLRNNVITILMNTKYETRFKSLSNRLSELYSYGLIEHFDINKSGGTWALKAGIDVNDDEELYRIAVQNITKLKGD